MDVSRGTTFCLYQTGFTARRKGDAKKFPPLAGMVSRRETVFSFKLRPKGNGVPRWRGKRSTAVVEYSQSIDADRTREGFQFNSFKF